MDHHDLTGYYTYRSFRNRPDPTGEFNEIRFGLHTDPELRIFFTEAYARLRRVPGRILRKSEFSGNFAG